jgi:hypothetical protein
MSFLATAITLVETTSGPTTITLPGFYINPDTNRINGLTYVIRDKDGSANSNSITIEAGRNKYNDEQTFTDGSTSFQINQSFGFAVITEQSAEDDIGVYRITSTSEYPEGSTDILTEQLLISTATAIPNIKIQDTQNSNYQYGLLVSTGILSFQTITPTTIQPAPVIQVTSNQFQSTFSSFANAFYSDQFTASTISSSRGDVQFGVVGILNASSNIVTNPIITQSGQICSFEIFADTVDVSTFKNSFYISTGSINASVAFISTIENMNNLEAGEINVTGQSYVEVGLADSISAATGFIQDKLIAENVSTDTFFMKETNINPAFINYANIPVLVTGNISSLDAHISSITTNSIDVRGNVQIARVVNTNNFITNTISANTIQVADGRFSTLQISTLFSLSSGVSSVIASTVYANLFSSANLAFDMYETAALSTNTISTNLLQASQLNVSTIIANQLYASTFINARMRFSTISTNQLSTGSISIAFISFSTMSTLFYSTISTIAQVVNIGNLSTNGFSTSFLTVGDGEFRSTIASTIAANEIPRTDNAIFLSTNVQTISVGRLNVSTLSTIGQLTVSQTIRTSTIRNTGLILPNISVGFATINTVTARTTNIINGQTELLVNGLSVNILSVGVLAISTLFMINRLPSTTNQIFVSTGVMTGDLMNINTLIPSVANTQNILTNHTIDKSIWLAGAVENGIYSSYNGSTWNYITGSSNLNKEIRDIDYSPSQNLWVAVSGTQPTIMVSQNLSNWIAVPNLFTRAFGVTYNPYQNLWLACGCNGANVTLQGSSNGYTWSTIINTFSNGGVANKARYSPEQKIWVVVGATNNTPGTVIQTSPDGFTWTTRYSSATSAGPNQNSCRDVDFDPLTNTWVAVLRENGALISRDAINWSNTNNGDIGTLNFAVKFGPQLNRWVLSGQTSGGGIKLSANGSNWSNAIAPSGFSAGYGISYNRLQRRFVIANDDGTNNSVCYSDNGCNWTFATMTPALTNGFYMTKFIEDTPDIFSRNLSFFNTLSTINYETNTMNSIIAFSSILILNSTLSLNTSTNKIGINVQNPVNELQTNSITGANYVNTINPTQSFVQRFITTSTLNTNTISLTSLLNCSTGLLSTNNITIQTLKPSSLVLLLPRSGATNCTFTTVDGVNFTSTVIQPFFGSGATVDGVTPAYNNISNFFVFPLKTSGTSFTGAAVYSFDLKTVSSFNTGGFKDGTVTYANNNTTQLLGGITGTQGVLYTKSDLSPVGVWTSNASLSGILNTGVNFIAWNGTAFLACGSGSSHTLAWSSNGTSWTGLGKTAIGSSAVCAAYSPSIGRWVAVGQSNAIGTTGYVATTTAPNAASGWITVTSPISFSPTSTVYYPNFVATDNNSFVLAINNANNAAIPNLYRLRFTGTTCNFEPSLLSTSQFTMANSNGFQRGTYSVVWAGTYWFASGYEIDGSTDYTSATSTDGLRWFPNRPNYPLTSQYGSLCLGNNVLPLELVTLQSRNLTVSTINASRFSTNQLVLNRIQPEFYLSLLSTTVVSSMIGLFSSIAMPSSATTEYSLNVNGKIRASLGVFSNTIAVTSDSNIKTNIQLADINQCFQTMESMPLKRFTYLPEHSEGIQDKTHLGFIAQEVQSFFPKEIFPIQTDDGSQTILHLSFDQIFMNSFGATQQLMTIVEERQSTITSLYSTVESLKIQLSTLKGNNV